MKRFSIVRHWKIFFTITVLFLLIGYGSMIFRGFNMGIDFTGGTIIDLKYMCDDYIRKGYGEKSVLLSNGSDDGYHGMYFGFGPEDEYEDYVTLD